MSWWMMNQKCPRISVVLFCFLPNENATDCFHCGNGSFANFLHGYVKLQLFIHVTSTCRLHVIPFSIHLCCLLLLYTYLCHNLGVHHCRYQPTIIILLIEAARHCTLQCLRSSRRDYRIKSANPLTPSWCIWNWIEILKFALSDHYFFVRVHV